MTMQMTGRLTNASGTGTDDVFDGYAIEIRYYVEVSEDTFRVIEQREVCEGADPSFAFTLSDGDLAWDRELQISVRNRRNDEVHRQTSVLAEALRQPLALPIQQIEPAVVATPVTLKGRLQWKATPTKLDGFGGFTIRVSYQEATGGIVMARQATMSLAGPPTFTIGLPAAEALNGPVVLSATAPDGALATTQTVAVAALKNEVVLVVEAPQPIVVQADPRAEEAQPERLKGKVVDLAGKVQIAQRQVILWGKLSSGVLKPLVVTVADGFGNFSGERPKDVVTGAWGTVAGTQNATVETAVAIDLVDLTDAESRAGRMPAFVYLVVELGAAWSTSDEHECTCDGTVPPRQPDAEDLVTNAAAYSQDIGPNCVNFTTPNRTLEEFVYTLVVRTTDPEIKGTTLADLERRSPALVGVQTFDSGDTVLQGPKALSSPAFRLAPGTGLTLPKTAASGVQATALVMAPKLQTMVTADPPAAWKNLYKTVPGRAALTANNSVDWDGTPTFYQAATIAHGHILYYKQVWKADGYSLGDLLYSLPLAPGQKKQIVTFDWDRTEFGQRDEASHEDEGLSAYLSHNRDIDDITQGRVAEQMRAGSHAETESSSGGIGGGIFGGFFGIAGGFSSSSSSSSSSAWQDSSRDVAASGLNQLRDFVQQGASAVRNQRSTVVQTARQTEQFRVETEVVANHNHCHAITIEYFEVLRHYAIEQQLTHVQECLFVPLLMSAFDIAKIMRWRDLLRAVLLLPWRRLAPFGQHPLVRGLEAAERIFLNYEGSDFPTGSYAEEGITEITGELWVSFRLNRPLDDDDNADDPARQEQLILPATLWNAPGWGVWWPLLPGGPNETYAQYFAHQAVKYKQKIFEERVAPVLAEQIVDRLQLTAVSRTGVRYPLALDTTLVSTYQRDVALYVTVRPAGPINVRRDQIEFLELATDVDLAQAGQSKVIVHRATLYYATPHLRATLTTDSWVENDLAPGDPVVLATPLSVEEKRKPREDDRRYSRLLIEHLNAHLEYYHKAIWARMDPDRRYMLLDGFVAPGTKGKSVASVVENRVIGVAGNCLILPVAPGYKLDPTYQYAPVGEGEPPVSLLDHYKPLTPAPPYRVSVPTRGVFAEAVMGACQSCEKWDERRYWKWEEHPIPEEPTPVAPVATQPPQRSEPGALTPTPFPTPLVTIQTAPAAPDPGATVAGALGLLGKPGLFPNLTGLEQTQQNALQALLSNQESAKHFADKASQLALQAATTKTGPSTIESIKQSMGDGTLDKTTGQQLIADAYRAQISGQTSAARPANTANNSDLAQAGAAAVRQGRPVKVSTDHPDGTSTTVDQRHPTTADGEGAPGTGDAGTGSGTGADAGTTIATTQDLTDEFVTKALSHEFQNAKQINDFFVNAFGKDFIDWFNAEHAAKQTFSKNFGPASLRRDITIAGANVKGNFEQFWNRLDVVFGKAKINLIEFITLMTSPINEVTGNLTAIAEMPQSTQVLKYFYETRGYNVQENLNWTAQKCFNDASYRAAHEKNPDGTKKKYATELAGVAGDEWKTTTYPANFSTDPSPAESGYIREADFYKFRGRGVIQITHRSAYRALIGCVIDYPDSGASTIVKKYRNDWKANMSDASRRVMLDKVASMTTNEHWTELFGDTEFLCKSVKVFSDSKGKFLELGTTAAKLNSEDPGSIFYVGRQIGWADYGRSLFRPRALQLLNSLASKV
jgi:hypothetical protein